MPPKSTAPEASSSKSDPKAAAHPYRRTNGQPKSSRQQFSACGACRMRRVRCDLKDLQAAGANGGGPPSCSNCLERGMKCVDEFAEVKAVKLLRRGRRLQQAEAVYGKVPGPDSTTASIPTPIAYKQSVIPALKPEFFSSPFYRRFHIQRPIVDPTEFSARYYDFLQSPPPPPTNGTPGLLPPLTPTPSLSVAGQLIAKLLVTWAASYGVDESGNPEPHGGVEGVRRRKRKCCEMVRELLSLIDLYGILRRPSWDGVRVLLLIMPLTEDVQSPLDRLSMYEATVNQVYTLCSLASVSSVNSGQGEFVDALVRARIFWYAHVHEGITTGLRGGRLLLADEDLSSFQTTLPPLGNNNALTRTSLTYTYTYRYATAPIRLAAACRQVHASLTGPKARASEEIDETKLREAWEALERSWVEFEGLRHLGPVGIIQPEDTERFVNGWQIFIFECHNIIREALKQRLLAANARGHSGAYLVEVGQQPPEIRLGKAARLHAIAESKCHDVAKHVVNLVRRHLGTSFFEYDASLVRDGCFFAGFLLAGENGSEEDVKTCLQALSEMRWAFSKSEERQQSLMRVWENRKQSEEMRRSADSAGSGNRVPLYQTPSPSSSSGGHHRASSVASDVSSHSRAPRPAPLHIPPMTATINPGPLTGGSDGYHSQPHSPFTQPHSPYTQAQSPFQQPHSPFAHPSSPFTHPQHTLNSTDSFGSEPSAATRSTASAAFDPPYENAFGNEAYTLPTPTDVPGTSSTSDNNLYAGFPQTSTYATAQPTTYPTGYYASH